MRHHAPTRCALHAGVRVKRIGRADHVLSPTIGAGDIPRPTARGVLECRDPGGGQYTEYGTSRWIYPHPVGRHRGCRWMRPRFRLASHVFNKLREPSGIYRFTSVGQHRIGSLEFALFAG